MKTKFVLPIGLALISMPHLAIADEIGLGHDRDNPGSVPAEPSSSAASETIWQEILEWFETDAEQ